MRDDGLHDQQRVIIWHFLDREVPGYFRKSTKLLVPVFLQYSRTASMLYGIDCCEWNRQGVCRVVPILLCSLSPAAAAAARLPSSVLATPLVHYSISIMMNATAAAFLSKFKWPPHGTTAHVRTNKTPDTRL